jgi:hypothetical protein
MHDLFANPVPAPHKTKRFWIFLVLGLVPILFAPLYMVMMGFRPFPPRVQIHSGVITFATWTAIFWFASDLVASPGSLFCRSCSVLYYSHGYTHDFSARHA